MSGVAGTDPLFDVADRGVIVTGGASGLGLAMARALALRGARVTILDRQVDLLDAVRDDLAREGAEVRTEAVDVTDRNRIDSAMKAASEWSSGLHVVFANAGITAGPGPFIETGALENIDSDRWREVLDVNVTGVLNTIRSASIHLAVGYGRIVVTSSIAGIMAEPLVGYAYSASKAAVVALTWNAAVELAPRGILVNAIAPGPFRTRLGATKWTPDRQLKLDSFIRNTALKRMGEPSEIEGIALFLASPASSFVTGAVIPIDGGTGVVRG